MSDQRAKELFEMLGRHGVTRNIHNVEWLDETIKASWDSLKTYSYASGTIQTMPISENVQVNTVILAACLAGGVDLNRFLLTPEKRAMLASVLEEAHQKIRQTRLVRNVNAELFIQIGTFNVGDSI